MALATPAVAQPMQPPPTATAPVSALLATAPAVTISNGQITAKVARGDWRVYEVGISYAGRTYAEGKKIGWRDGVRAFYCIVRYSGTVERSARRARA